MTSYHHPMAIGFDLALLLFVLVVAAAATTTTTRQAEAFVFVTSAPSSSSTITKFSRLDNGALRDGVVAVGLGDDGTRLVLSGRNNNIAGGRKNALMTRNSLLPKKQSRRGDNGIENDMETKSIRGAPSSSSSLFLFGRGGAAESSGEMSWSKKILSIVTGVFVWAYRELSALNRSQKALFLATFLSGVYLGGKGPIVPLRRFTQVSDIPSSFFGPNAPVLPGRAITVSDGDTIRFLHTPTPFHPTALRKEKKEKASTVALPVRICTIDTPETAKFGKPGQAFGVEAKEYLTEFLGDGVVGIRLLQKDQYGRAVAQVFKPSVPGGGRLWMGPKKHVDETMLKQGLAEVYTGGGAVYGPKGLDAYLEMENEAREQKLGIWSQGDKRQSAADYKKKFK